MVSNQKVESAFAALDMELEILTKAQQQIVIGGSGGTSSGGEAGDSKEDTLLKQLWGIGSGSSSYSSSFVVGVGVNVEKFKSSLEELVKTRSGFDLLTELQASGKKWKLNSEGTVPNGSSYDNSNGTYAGEAIEGSIDVKNFVGGKAGMGLVGHELFHAAQDLAGKGGKFVDNELEAQIFHVEVEYESGMYQAGSGFSMGSFGAYSVSGGVPTYTTKGQAYQSALYNVARNGLTKERWNTLAENFKDGSSANMSNGFDPSGAPTPGEYATYNDSTKIATNQSLADIQLQIKNFLH